MNKILLISILFICFACNQENQKLLHEAKTVHVICNQEKSISLNVSDLVDENGDYIPLEQLDFNLESLSGKELINSIKITSDAVLIINSQKLGIAKYKIDVSSNNKHVKTITLNIISEFLLDFTQCRPMEPTGSISGINYPEDSLVKVSEKIVGVDTAGTIVSISPGLLVRHKIVPFPHNSQYLFPEFKQAINYYGYKENTNKFNFRYQPIIPMLEVGDGDDNRGVGIIVINKDQLQNDPEVTYIFEGYCSIRTRTDAKETYNLGVVIGTINENYAVLKDVINARDYFNIGYSSSGQIFSNPFHLKNDDYLTINIVGEAGKGRDKNRTTRFEYIKITPQ